MTGKPAVSIVLPVYNVEEWITETIRSIQNQTIDNWEAVFVIDGSSDGSEEIVRSFAEKDDRIKVINQTNQGISKARDFGVNNSKGEYLFFLDPDDLMPPDAMEKSCQVAEKNQADIVIGDFMFFDDQGDFIPKQAPSSEKFRSDFDISKKIFNRNDIDDDIFYFDLHLISASIKLFNTDFLKRNKIVPTTGTMLADDKALAKTLLLSAKRICTVDSILMYYRRGRENSQTHKRSRKSFGVFNAYEDTKKSYIKMGVSKKEMSLMYSAFITYFYVHLTHYTPFRDWISFYRKICLTVQGFERNMMDFQYMDKRIVSNIQLLSKNNLIYIVPYLLSFRIYTKIIPVLLHRPLKRVLTIWKKQSPKEYKIKKGLSL